MKKPVQFESRAIALMWWLMIACFDLSVAVAADVTWPGKTWERRAPEEVGLGKSAVDRFAAAVLGDGCIIKDGYLVGAWGDYTAQGEWGSAGKSALGTLLMLAAKDNVIPAIDFQVLACGWDLRLVDYQLTFRQLADMTSGYARVEPPGAAWAYNDVAINLYVHSLKRVFATEFEQVFSRKLATLQFEDPPFFGTPDGVRVTASPRDFARLGWLWLHRGAWKGEEIIPRAMFDDCVRPVAADLARSSKYDDDYLDVGTYGGDSDQTPHGPGIYGFSFWFNRRLPNHARRVWPSLPADVFQANGGWNVHTVTMIPSWKMVVVVRKGRMGAFTPGESDSRMDQRLRMLTPSGD